MVFSNTYVLKIDYYKLNETYIDEVRSLGILTSQEDEHYFQVFKTDAHTWNIQQLPNYLTNQTEGPHPSIECYLSYEEYKNMNLNAYPSSLGSR